jgi:type II secretory pathway pseudopilin PulG
MRAAIIAVVVVVITVVAGLVVAGSPKVERQRRLDERRTQDLEILVAAINRHYTHHQSLPPSLDTLRIEHQLLMPPVDPETRAPYRYEVTGPTGYRLCATFQQPSNDAFGRASWAHDTGTVCFDREPLTAK